MGAESPYSPCENIGLCFVFGCNNRQIVYIVLFSEGYLQLEVMCHFDFARKTDHGIMHFN